MFIYIFIYITIILISTYYFFKTKNNNKLLLVIVLFLGLFSGARNESLGGYDTSMYKYFYEKSSDSFPNIQSDDAIVNSIEFGYVATMSFFKTIGVTFNYFLLLLGCFSSVSLYFIFKRYTLYPFLVLTIFLSKGYLYYFFTAQRQVIAMMICWLALKFVLDKKPVKFIASIIIASLFHASALAFILVYVLANMQINNKKAIIFIVLSVIIGVLGIGTLFSNILSSVLPFGGEKLLGYVQGGSNMINILNFVEIIPVLIFVLYNRSVISERTKYFNLFFNLFLIYILITFAFYDFAIIARLKGYFIIGYIVIIATIPYVFKTKKQGVVVLYLLFFYLFAVFVRELLVFDSGEGYLPYHTFFSQLKI